MEHDDRVSTIQPSTITSINSSQLVMIMRDSHDSPASILQTTIDYDRTITHHSPQPQLAIQPLCHRRNSATPCWDPGHDGGLGQLQQVLAQPVYGLLRPGSLISDINSTHTTASLAVVIKILLKK